MWRYASSCVLSGAIAARGASPVFAAEPPCSTIAVAVDESVRAHWPDLPAQVRQAFEARTDIDACARIELTMNEGSIAVGVNLADGRSATRRVSRREDILPTLEALLLVPRPTPPASGVATSAPSVPPPAPTQTVQAAIPVVPVQLAVPQRDEVETGRASYPPTRFRIELSVVTDARIGDGQTSVGLGALSFVDIGGWLVGFEGRADRDQRIGRGYGPGTALELAALGGRRFRFHGLALDLVGGPAVALRADASGGTTVTPGGSPSPSSSGTVPRALLGAHLIFRARSSFRTFIGIDGEFGPANTPGDNPIDEFPLPVWTVGLALGGTVGTQ